MRTIYYIIIIMFNKYFSVFFINTEKYTKHYGIYGKIEEMQWRPHINIIQMGLELFNNLSIHNKIYNL